MILLPSELQAARKARGLSQGDLARISGVHTMLISKLERGAGGANCSTMERLTVALQIQVLPPAADQDSAIVAWNAAPQGAGGGE